MDTIVFTCETITPLVMNGPYGNNDPELRPPGIKTSLRFWWRALHGHLTIVELREKEGKIFGSTKGRSKVIIHVEENIDENKNKYISILPHKGGSIAKTFDPMNDFKIRIDFDAKVISKDEIKNLFILSCTLGGWGKRSRRGFGSVQVTGIDQQSYKCPVSIDGIFELLDKNYFEKTDKRINSIFKRSEAYPYLKSVELGNPFNNNSDLLKRIGSSSSTSKKENNDSWDYRNSLGHTSKRFASPYYVSVIRDGNDFYPIFTSLNIATDRGNNMPQNANQIQNDFKNRIL